VTNCQSIFRFCNKLAKYFSILWQSKYFPTLCWQEMCDLPRYLGGGDYRMGKRTGYLLARGCVTTLSRKEKTQRGLWSGLTSLFSVLIRFPIRERLASVSWITSATLAGNFWQPVGACVTGWLSQDSPLDGRLACQRDAPSTHAHTHIFMVKQTNTRTPSPVSLRSFHRRNSFSVGSLHQHSTSSKGATMSGCS
jgi:hypothetical protein